MTPDEIRSAFAARRPGPRPTYAEQRVLDASDRLDAAIRRAVPLQQALDETFLVWYVAHGRSQSSNGAAPQAAVGDGAAPDRADADRWEAGGVRVPSSAPTGPMLCVGDLCTAPHGGYFDPQLEAVEPIHRRPMGIGASCGLHGRDHIVPMYAPVEPLLPPVERPVADADAEQAAVAGDHTSGHHLPATS